MTDVQKIAAELAARALEDVLTGGGDGRATALPSARHVANLSENEMRELIEQLQVYVAEFRELAGPFANRANRDIPAIRAQEAARTTARRKRSQRTKLPPCTS